MLAVTLSVASPLLPACSKARPARARRIGAAPVDDAGGSKARPARARRLSAAPVDDAGAASIDAAAEKMDAKLFPLRAENLQRLLREAQADGGAAIDEGGASKVDAKLFPLRAKIVQRMLQDAQADTSYRPADIDRESITELLKRAGATRQELALAEKSTRDGEDAAVVQYLLDDAGFTAGDLSEMLSLKPALARTASVEKASETVEFLNATFNLRKCDLRKIFREQPGLLLPSEDKIPLMDTGACPAVLATASGGPAAGPRSSGSASTNVYDVVYLLSSVGVKPKNIKEMVVRWPQLLTLPVAQMLAVTDYLGSLQFEGSVGSLYRQHPWVLAAPMGTVRRAVEVLVDDIGVRRLENIIRAYPRALVKSQDDLLEPVRLLLEVGLEQEDVVSVVETFPLLFGLEPLATRGVLAFWRDELGLRKADVPRVCRAFPSLLGVDVQRQRRVVAFLREIGVVNVARFATRLPPVLAYDVDADLRPKMAHLAASALSVYDVVRFPAYFSYPLDTVIRPRTAFMETYDLPLTRFELKTLVTPADGKFASRVVGAPPQEYAAFKAAFLADLANPKKPKGGFLAAFVKPAPSPLEGKAAFPTLSPGAPGGAGGTNERLTRRGANDDADDRKRRPQAG